MKRDINVTSIISLVAQLVSIYYSFEFFYKINMFFGVVIVLFESTLFFITPKIRDMESWKKVIALLVVTVIYGFSILGVVSNGYNFILEDNQKQFKAITNDQYTEYVANRKVIETQIADYKDQLNKYPTLETFTANSPKWEDKAGIINNWSLGKQKLQDSLNQANNKLGELKAPSKTVTKKIKNSGYNAMLDKINEITGIKVENCILILTLIVAITLQMIILVCRLAPKKVNIEIKSPNIFGHKFKVKKAGKHISNIPENRVIEENNNLESVTNATNILPNISNIPENSKVKDILTYATNIPLTENVTPSNICMLENESSNIPESSEVEGITDHYNVVKSDMLLWLNDKYDIGDTVTKKDVMNRYNFARYEYDKIRNELVKEKVLKTLPNKTMVYNGKNKLKRVK